jgi:hypothetical protein
MHFFIPEPVGVANSTINSNLELMPHPRLGALPHPEPLGLRMVKGRSLNKILGKKGSRC